ncbi:transmembrane protein 186 [Teleopsis dalmanni]|uniref:transmembrane protein 186 n=1 Tax=Teleopsis dalmanni TaxID=139649 RepID=UPI0018CEF306|nr:transmembrane protein 186 [Teleopsis dalmanni]
MNVLQRGFLQSCRFSTVKNLYKIPAAYTCYGTELQHKKLMNTHRMNTTFKSRWETIYQLPIIRAASVVSQIKTYQGIATAISVPISYAFEQAVLFPTNTCLVVTIIGASGLITLTLFSLVIRNLIGFIYINSEEQKIKFAYLDFWGKRKERIADVSAIEVNNEEKSFQINLV